VSLHAMARIEEMWRVILCLVIDLTKKQTCRTNRMGLSDGRRDRIASRIALRSRRATFFARQLDSAALELLCRMNE
jgi:hypothetical protein